MKAAENNFGKVYLAGAGPWDEGLVTLKCAEVLSRADAVVFDSLVNPSVLNLASDGAELIYAGKRAGRHSMPQEEINAVLIRLAKDGKSVVRLKGGDPYIFGRGGEEAEALTAEGIEFEVISGVSSAYAVPAAAGIAVTDRKFASSVHIITGHSGVSGNAPDYEVLARLRGTLVFMMGKAALPEIAAELIKNGKPASTPCAVVSEGTSPRQQCVSGTLADIAEKAERLPSPAVIVVGAAAGRIFEQKKSGMLSGKRIINAGRRGTLGDLEAEALGAEVLRIPLIRTRKTDNAADISGCGCIAFASAAGVQAFFEAYNGDIRELAGIKMAAVGARTAEEIKKHAIIPDIIPQNSNAEGLCGELSKALEKGTRILLPCSVQGGAELCEGLKAAGFDAVRAELYSTEPDFSRAELLRLYEETADYIILTSGSCADAYMKMTSGKSTAKLIAIGRAAAERAEGLGLKISASAKTPDAAGVIEAVLGCGCV